MSDPVNKSLGISFSDNKINFIELTHDNSVKRLNYFESVEADIDFEGDLSKYKSDQKILTNISGEIQKILNKRGAEFSHVSLSLSASQSHILILPIDVSEGSSSLNSKIYWELSHYFPENYNELVINTYNLNSVMPSSHCSDILIIAVFRNVLEFARRIFKLVNIELSLIDIDHFSAEHALRAGYMDDLRTGNILMIGFKQGRYDFGYISKGKYKYFTYTRYQSGPEHNLVLVKKLKNVLSSSYVTNNVDKIIVYGNNIPEDSVSAIKRVNDVKIEYLNPFLSVSASSDFLQNDEIRKQYYKYSSSCGAALRNI